MTDLSSPLTIMTANAISEDDNTTVTAESSSVAVNNKRKHSNDDFVEEEEEEEENEQENDALNNNKTKLSYSIMNILSNSNKSTPPPTKAQKLSNENNFLPTQNSNINQFLLNPFLAAAAAAQSFALQNNATKTNSQANELWPWLNMAAVSALYGFDSKYFHMST